jgi:hypothetical protein
VGTWKQKGSFAIVACALVIAGIVAFRSSMPPRTAVAGPALPAGALPQTELSSPPQPERTLVAVPELRVPRVDDQVDAEIEPGAPITLNEQQAKIVTASVLEYLESAIPELRKYLASPRSVTGLGELLAEHQRRVDLRKYEVFVEKARRGELRFVRSGRGVPPGMSGKLYLVTSSFNFEGTGSVDSVLEVRPGEDQELDAIVRTASELALAHAEELAGAFNNLPLEERERRTRRILELRAATRNAAVAAELSELGEHEYLELVPERLAMEVRAYVRDWTWGGRR